MSNELEKKLNILQSHLERTLKEFPKAIKAVYYDGFKDARDEDYLGCDVMARWESSESKKAIDDEH